MDPNTTNPTNPESNDANVTNTADSSRSEHREQESRKLSKVGRSLFKYVEFDDNETILTEIRKHSFGLFIIIFTGLGIALILMVVLTTLALNINSFGIGAEGDSNSFGGILIGIGLLLSLLALIITGVTAILYRLNVVYITSEKIAQVDYASIFNRRINQLNIGKVEDVTITQHGMFAYIFNYGGLLVETAGELPNKVFSYVPRPNEKSQIIIDAHEKYVEKYGN